MDSDVDPGTIKTDELFTLHLFTAEEEGNFHSQKIGFHKVWEGSWFKCLLGMIFLIKCHQIILATNSRLSILIYKISLLRSTERHYWGTRLQKD